MGIEGDEIGGRFAKADPEDRKGGGFLESGGDASFRGAIEFGEDDASDGSELVEGAGLVEGVLPGGGIENEECLVGCGREEFLDGAAYFGKFVHEVGFVLEAACGVDEDKV